MIRRLFGDEVNRLRLLAVCASVGLVVLFSIQHGRAVALIIVLWLNALARIYVELRDARQVRVMRRLLADLDEACWWCDGSRVCPECDGRADIVGDDRELLICAGCRGTGWCRDCMEVG